MVWGERLLGAVGILRELSSGLSCPFHCGSSTVTAFGFGLSLGLLLGVLATAYFAHFLLLPRVSVPCQVPPEPTFASSDLRRRTRLSGYLHE